MLGAQVIEVGKLTFAVLELDDDQGTWVPNVESGRTFESEVAQLILN